MQQENQGIPPLIAAMLKADTYDYPVDECKLIETHISWVILTGIYAYKIKKPVNLGFLDFATLEKRHFYCQEEVRLNSRLAPDIYLSVLTISGSPEQPSLQGDGEAIEYAVQMKEFSQDAQFDRMLGRGELDNRHMDALAHRVAEFHSRIEVVDQSSDFGDPAHVYQPVKDTINIFREHSQGKAQLASLDYLDHWCQTQFESLTDLLLERKALGFIRECHGDMHLRNLAWIDHKPAIFDCIEFNPNLSKIDVMSEVAFLVMDLDDRQQTRMAQRFLNAYLENTGDYRGTKLIPFYLVYRALVRGMVAAIRADQGGISTPDLEEAHKEIQDYLMLANRYTQQKKAPVIILRGLSGSGKTSLSQDLLESLGAIRIRSDVERKRLYGLRADENGKAAINEGIYTSEATARTYLKLTELAGEVLEAGYPVIIDATCQTYAQRRGFYELAEKANTAYIILEFQTSPDTLRKRIQARQGDASDADLMILEHQLLKWESLPTNEKKYAIEIDTERPFNAEQVKKQIMMCTL